MSWKAKGDVRSLDTLRDTDVDAVNPDLGEDELTPEITGQVNAAHAAAKSMILAGAVGGQGELVELEISGHATDDHLHTEDSGGETVTVTISAGGKPKQKKK